MVLWGLVCEGRVAQMETSDSSRACGTLNCIRVGCTLGASGMETDWITGDDKVVPV